MGILDKLGETIKNTASSVKAEMQRRKEIAYKKERILSRFTIEDLKKLCKEHIGYEPSPYYENPITGERTKRVVDKDVYIGFIKDKVTLENIIDFASKNKIGISDLLAEWQKTENASIISKDTTFQASQTAIVESSQANKTAPQEKSEATGLDEFDAILDFIQKEFRPNPVRDETELENQLVQFLRPKYGGVVQEQVPTPYGRVDIVLFNKYALELKLATNRNNLRDMEGQLRDYKKVYPNLAAIILRVNVNYNDINYYVNEYAKDGIKSVVIEGQLRSGRKRGERGINIRF
jgi:hypothetical protein